MTKTEIASLALSYLGEPPLASYDTDTSTAAIAARTHYPTTLATILETHPWSFARASTTLPPSQVTVTYSPVSGNPFSVDLSLTTFSSTATTYSGTDALSNIFTLTKSAANTYAQLSAVDAGNANLPAYAATTEAGQFPSGALAHSQPWTVFDSSLLSITTAATTSFKPWSVQHTMPTSCIRLLRIATSEATLERFEIAGSKILTDHDSFLTLIYTDGTVAESSFPQSFTNALVLALASDMCRILSQSEATANDLLQKHKIALNLAITKDTRETQSNENMTPRRLAARSNLYQSRFRSHGAPGLL